jgi:hypothetical protein
MILQFSNHRLIIITNTIYKLFTNILTTIFSGYGKKHQTFHDSQKGAWVERCIAKQLQRIVCTLEDVKFTNQDIYLFYINFKIPLNPLIMSNCWQSWLTLEIYKVQYSISYRKYIFIINYNIYWKTLWLNETNTYTKGHNPRWHP